MKMQNDTIVNYSPAAGNMESSVPKPVQLKKSLEYREAG